MAEPEMTDRISSMRHISSIIIAVLIACGCSSSREALLVTWHSPNSSAEQRVDAATKLVPLGATKEEAERILGGHGSWTHRHGPSLEFPTEPRSLDPRPTKDYDEWTLDYQVPGGVVVLFFEKREDASGGFRFARAAFGKSLEISPNGRLY